MGHTAKNNKLITNKFYHYAIQYIKHLTDESEIMKIDMTKEFWEEIELIIRDKEILTMEINAKMRLSKSTTGIAIGQKVFNILKKYKYKQKQENFGIKNIARDQQEYSQIMRDPNTKFTIIVTDESNSLEKTGENVTVENAMYNDFSNIHAARYVHRINCSPKDQIDPNSDIILQIISVDRKNKITHAKLYYKIYEAGTEYVQLLGRVSIPVGELINNWIENIQPIFIKGEQNWTTKEKEIIKKAEKEDYYSKYMIRKHQKMELLTKEGIFRPRTMQYSEIIKKVIEQLKELTEIYGVVNPNLIKNYVKIEFRKAKIPTSIVGEELTAREAQGILKLHESRSRIAKKMLSKKNTKETMKHLNKLIQKIDNAIEHNTKEIENMIRVNKIYNEIK